MRNGFSLVELSIVLVILGLLVGGILAGQSLIRAAELRSIINDAQRYNTAMYTFRDRYMSLPGDMNSATRFWGFHNTTGCINRTGATTNAASGTCDGNGDGIMANAAAANSSAELFQFWRQLSLAGLIEGSYSGLSGASGASHAVIGTNVPASRITNTGWTPNYQTLADVISDGNQPVVMTGNHFRVGQVGGATTSQPFLKPEEMWNIDIKLDDGKPARGQLLVRSTINGCTTAVLTTDLDANYNLSNSGILCSMALLWK